MIIHYKIYVVNNFFKKTAKCFINIRKVYVLQDYLFVKLVGLRTLWAALLVGAVKVNKIWLCLSLFFLQLRLAWITEKKFEFKKVSVNGYYGWRLK